MATRPTLKNISQNMEEIKRNSIETEKSLKGVAGEFSEMKKTLKVVTDEMTDFEEETEKAVYTVDELKGKIKEFGIKGVKSAKDARKAIKELESSAKNLNKTGFSKAGEGLGKIGQMAKSFRGSPKDIRAAAGAAKDWAEKMRLTSTVASKIPGKLNMAAKAAEAVGVAAGGISKMLLGPVGWGMMIGKVLVDAAVKYDNWIKNLNKNFAMVRGPDVMTPDVKQQMHDFNSAIMDIGANIRDGLDNKEVYQFVDALYQSGTALSKVSNSMTGLRSATFIAAKAGAAFGLDIQQVGALMGDMMSKQHMSLNDLDKAFTQVSFDAQKSGLTTDQFWGAVKNATASLSLYGIFVKGLSKELTLMQKSRVAGTDDITNSFNKLNDSFKGMDEAAKGAFLSQVDPKDLSEAWDNASKRIQESLDDVKSKLKDNTTALEDARKKEKTLTDAGQKKELANRIAQLKEDRDRLINDEATFKSQQRMATQGKAAQGRGDVYGMGAAAGVLQDQLITLVASATKKMTGLNFTQAAAADPTHTMQIMRKALESLHFNLTPEENQILVNSIQNGAAATKYSVDKFSDKLIKLDKKNHTALSKVIDTNVAFNPNKPTLKTDQDAAKAMEDLGIATEEEAKDLLEGADANNQLKVALEKYIRAAAEEGGDPKKQAQVLAGAKQDLENILNSSDHALLMAKWVMKNKKSTDKVEKAEYNKNFEAIRTSTLTLDKMRKIGADGVLWQASSLSHLENMDDWITKIAVRYLKLEGAQQKAAKKDLKAMGINIGAGQEARVLAENKKRQSELDAIVQGKTKGDKEAAAAESAELDKKNSKILQSVSEDQKDNTQQMADLISDPDIRNDPEKQQQLYNLMKQQFVAQGKNTVTEAAIAGKVGDLSGAMISIARKPETKDTYTPAVESTGASSSYGVAGLASRGGSLTSAQAAQIQFKQGLQKPETATHAGAVILHPNETILPAKYTNFQTKPWAMGGNPGTAGAKQAPVVNFQMSGLDYMSYKRLKSRIHNEVREWAYYEQIG